MSHKTMAKITIKPTRFKPQFRKVTATRLWMLWGVCSINFDKFSAFFDENFPRFFDENQIFRTLLPIEPKPFTVLNKIKHR